MKWFKKTTPICLVFLGLAGSPVIAYAQGINFLHNLDEALAKAKVEDKLVFVDFYTSWCGPCKALSNEVFPLAEVGSFFNARFINCKIQCDDKGVGVELGKKYQVNAYPTLMFLDKNGEMVHSEADAPSAEGLIQLAKTAMDPQKNLLSIIKEWNSGNRDEAFTKKYFTTLKEAYRTEKATIDFNSYFNKLSAEDKVKKSTFELIKLLGIAPFSPVFEYLEANRIQYIQSTDSGEVDKFVATTYLGYLRNLVVFGTRAEFQAAKAKFKAKNYSYFEEYSMFCGVFETKDSTGKADINNYMQRGTAFLTKYGRNNDAYTLSLTSLLGNYTGRADAGVAGIKWMEDLLERNPDPNYLSVYFYILWRNFHFDKAIAVGKEMRANAIKAGDSTKTIDAQIAMVEGLVSKAAAKAQEDKNKMN
ncbi:thioredoxin family protein [Chitinophaga niastensis]|nr:thioredoxin domain-containing protein [Chitinophaga niastensis]